VTADIRRLAEFGHGTEFNNAELRRDAEVRRAPYNRDNQRRRPAISWRLRGRLYYTPAGTPSAKRTIAGIIVRSLCRKRQRVRGRGRGRGGGEDRHECSILTIGFASAAGTRVESSLLARECYQGRERGGPILKTARLIDARHLKGR